MIKMKRLLFVALAFGLLVGCSNDTNELSEKAEKETVELQENIEKEKENKLKEVEKVYIGVLESSISVFQDNVDGIRENFVKAEESPIMWIEGDWRMEQKSYFENIALELEILRSEKVTVELKENIEKEKENKLKEVEKVYIGVLESSISVFQDNVDGIRENFVKAEESPIMWIEGDWRMEQKSYFENIALELENL